MRDNRADIEELVLEYNMARISLAEEEEEEEEASIVISINDITERKRAEAALKESEAVALRLAEQNAIVAEIGRIISSTLNIEEVYARFADEMRKIMPFDRIVINIVNIEKNIVTASYAAGIPVPGRQPGDIFPLAGSLAEEVVRTRKALIFQPENEDEGLNRFPGLFPVVRAGLRSSMNIPLISRDKPMGILHFIATKPNAYTQDDLRLGQKIGAQITGAIVNAQLFDEGKRAEEALTKAYAELKEAQARLIQAEKAEVIGRLAGGVAHEVKNPLAIIMQGIDYLSANVPVEKEDVSLALKYMNDAVKRADNIIRGLMDFSQASEIKMAPENMNSIIESTLLFVKNLFDQHRIEIIKELGKGIEPLDLDKNRMGQVFLNLFLNAMDAMPGGGQIKVRTYKEEQTEDGGPGETVVVAEVEDTGAGIPEDVLNKIFDPFFTTKKCKGGTGLGLSVVKNIVDRHGGEIKIENRRDRSGVRVTVRFK